jgi:hypothetical protein
MKRMKCLLGILLLTFTFACGQSDKTFKEVVTFEKGFRFTSTGVIQTIPFTGGGTSMTYPSAGIPISTGTAWGTSITNNSTNWNAAYSWGNHALAGYAMGNHNHSTLYKPLSYVPTWTEVTGKPESIELVDAILSMQGVKLPVLTTVQINALTPTVGLLVYDSSLNVLKIYTGVWKTLITAN